jgi:hypothetical protein
MTKMLLVRDTPFFEEKTTTVSGRKIVVRRVQPEKGGATYRVSVDGRLVDSFLTLADARSKARHLDATLDAVL